MVGALLVVTLSVLALGGWILDKIAENDVYVAMQHLGMETGNVTDPDRRPVTRANAAVTLARLHEKALPAVPYLIANLPDETPLQWQVVYGGGPFETKDAFPNNEFTTPGKEAAKALVAIGPPAIPQLIEAMAGRMDLREAPELVAGQNPLVRAKVASQVTDVLVQIGQPAVEPLTKALDDPRWGVRAGAAEALGKLGDKNAIPALTAKLSDPKPPVREAAAEALERLGVPPIGGPWTTPEAAPDRQRPPR